MKLRKYDQVQLREAVKDSTSLRQVLEALGVAPYGEITRCCGARFATSISKLPTSPDSAGTKEKWSGRNNLYRGSLTTK
jgi:hypothetical protein